MDKYIYVFKCLRLYYVWYIEKKSCGPGSPRGIYTVLPLGNFSFIVHVIFRILVELFMLHAMAPLVFISCQVPQTAMNE
jgi:hypothetical protein